MLDKLTKPYQKAFLFGGISLILFSFLLFGLILYPLLRAELKYQIASIYGKSASHSFKLSKINPSNDEFKVIIPKIDVNSKVLPNIDPFNKQEYLNALSQGAAQAKGSANPGKEGNVFIFAHSTDSPLNVTRFNAVFYLISKLTAGDEIYLLYQGKSYTYIVEQIQIINPAELNYLNNQEKGQSLTLMTCWPPGTTLKRMLVKSHLVKG